MKDVKGEIIIFQHRNFRGHHRYIINQEENLNNAEDKSLNDKVSSFAILKGQWRVYRHSGFDSEMGLQGAPFGPGAYSWVEDYDIENDQMSSLKCVK